MNRNRLIVGLAIAVVVALLLSTFVYRVFKQAGAVRPAAVTQHIVVAAVPMGLGTRLDAKNVRLIPWPGGEPVAGMFTRIEDVANRALITSVVENEPILEGKLAPLQSGAGLSATIPEGMRALSVPVNDVVAVAGFVGPGTMVDLLVTAPAPGTVQNVTLTILENVRVLAAGQKVEQDRDGKPQTVPIITLLLTPQDAEKVTMASTQGRIQLALRNTIDSKAVAPPPVFQAVLFNAGAAPVKHSSGGKVAPVVPPTYVIEIISGNKRENKSFPNE
jgi:pilus assembly protein CpaB